LISRGTQGCSRPWFKVWASLEGTSHRLHAYRIAMRWGYVTVKKRLTCRSTLPPDTCACNRPAQRRHLGCSAIHTWPRVRTTARTNTTTLNVSSSRNTPSTASRSKTYIQNAFVLPLSDNGNAVGQVAAKSPSAHRRFKKCRCIATIRFSPRSRVSVRRRRQAVPAAPNDQLH
jgi:hypothetical protein